MLNSEALSNSIVRHFKNLMPPEWASEDNEAGQNAIKSLANAISKAVVEVLTTSAEVRVDGSQFLFNSPQGPCTPSNPIITAKIQ